MGYRSGCQTPTAFDVDVPLNYSPSHLGPIVNITNRRWFGDGFYAREPRKTDGALLTRAR